MASNKINIAIAGGGIAGLALAAGLHQNHGDRIIFHVYEAAKEYKDVGAGLAIHNNGITAMDLIHPGLREAYLRKGSLMGKEDQELSTQVIIAQGPFKDEVVAQLGTAKNRKSVGRADLLDGFATLVPKHLITFNKRLQTIHDNDDDEGRGGVHLTFTDNTTASADILIAADGVHSPTRAYILGPTHPAAHPVNHEHWYTYQTMLPMRAAREHGIAERWTKIVPLMLGSAGSLASLPVGQGSKLSVFATVPGLTSDAEGKPPPFQPEAFQDYSEDARKLVQLVAKDSTSWQLSDHDAAPTYYRGSVAMIGDAAHATMAFNGQGAAQALEDAAVLDHLFYHLDPNSSLKSQTAALFSAYDATRRPRSQRVAEISRKFGRMYTFREGELSKDLEEMRKVFKADGGYTNGFDLRKQNADALALFEKALRDAGVGANGEMT